MNLLIGTLPRRALFVLATLLVAALLPACASTAAPLADVAISAPVLQPSGKGESVTISYTVGQAARVYVYLVDAKKNRYVLRDGDARAASSEPYTLRFDGTAPTPDPASGLLRQLLPNGEYQYVVEARPAAGPPVQQGGALTIKGANARPPQIQNLVVAPQTITPNADGVDDTAEFTYQLPVTATVDLIITGPDKRPQPIVAGAIEGPTLQRHTWNGKTLDDAVLPNSVYTYTLRAQDRFGALFEQRGTIAIAGSGTPEATITASSIAPQAIALGGVITVTMRVKNTGTVPIRTYGPASGYEYTTNQVYSSVADGQYVAKSGGFWRAGVDWDANSGGVRRYPFRWAISPRPPGQWKVPNVEDELRPGEEAVITGRIRVEQPETKMSFYVGLTWDGVGFRQDRVGRTLIRVGF